MVLLATLNPDIKLSNPLGRVIGRAGFSLGTSESASQAGCPDQVCRHSKLASYLLNCLNFLMGVSTLVPSIISAPMLNMTFFGKSSLSDQSSNNHLKQKWQKRFLRITLLYKSSATSYWQRQHVGRMEGGNVPPSAFKRRQTFHLSVILWPSFPSFLFPCLQHEVRWEVPWPYTVNWDWWVQFRMMLDYHLAIPEYSCSTILPEMLLKWSLPRNLYWPNIWSRIRICFPTCNWYNTRKWIHWSNQRSYGCQMGWRRLRAWYEQQLASSCLAQRQYNHFFRPPVGVRCYIRYFCLSLALTKTLLIFSNYAQPTIYSGPTLTTIATEFPSGRWQWTFRCQNCVSWVWVFLLFLCYNIILNLCSSISYSGVGNGVTGSITLDSTSVFGWAYSTVAVDTPSSASSTFAQHTDFRLYGHIISNAHTALYVDYLDGSSTATVSSASSTTSSSALPTISATAYDYGRSLRLAIFEATFLTGFRPIVSCCRCWHSRFSCCWSSLWGWKIGAPHRERWPQYLWNRRNRNPSLVDWHTGMNTIDIICSF